MICTVLELKRHCHLLSFGQLGGCFGVFPKIEFGTHSVRAFSGDPRPGLMRLGPREMGQPLSPVGNHPKRLLSLAAPLGGGRKNPRFEPRRVPGLEMERLLQGKRDWHEAGQVTVSL